MVSVTAVAVVLIGIGFANVQANVKTRIVGGNAATPGEFPSHVSLRDRNNYHICSGSIIVNPNWVLTAAHCTDGYSAHELRIIAGSNYLLVGGTSYAVKKVIKHPQYNSYNKINDISLIRPSRKIAITLTVRPIPISFAPPKTGTACFLSGWGATIPPYNQHSNSLQAIGVHTIGLQQCQALLSGYPVYHSNVCTITGQGQGVCNGDSGAPLICNGVQYGIVSWAVPCASGKPDVHTSIDVYYSWILKEMYKNGHDNDSDSDESD